MPVVIKLQKLSENLEGGKVLEVRVVPGNKVEKDQVLLEVEAEKASVEVLAPSAGEVKQVQVKKGDEITVGQTLVILDGADQAAEDAPKAANNQESKPKEAPSKAPSAPEAKPKESAQPQETAPAAHAAKPAAATAVDDGKPVPAGPATRRLARELGINLRQVAGSGRSGRIMSEDVKAFVRQLAAGTAVRSNGAVAAPALPNFEQWGKVDRKPLEQVRRRTAEHLSMAWNLIPHVTQHDQTDLTELEAFRRQQDTTGPKLTVTAFALKAAAIALKQFPQFNSSIDMAGGQLIVKQYVNIGIAVDTERGLLVPVVRDVDKKSVHELAQELGEIAKKARDKKLSIDDMRGGCFTITNLGGIGGTAFTPIVNYPEVAILGMSRARMTPVVHGGQVVPRLILTLSLSYDHRVIDGADGARFTRRLCDMLENPMKMLVHA